MEKLLIAVNSKEFAEAVSQCLDYRFDIAVCHTGQEALQLLREFRPNVFAVDLMLPGIDGIGVLKLAQGLGIRPRVLALSAYISDYVTNALDCMNVACLVRIPCDYRQFAARILDVADWQKQEPSLQTELQAILTALGFQINHGGCLATEACVRHYLKDPRQKLVSQIYPAAAAELGGTYNQIDRAMGRAIEAAWASRDEQIWRLYFPLGKNGTVERPTNAQFLAVIAGYLTHWIEREKQKAIG